MLYMRGLDYDRTNYEELSKPVAKETRQKALDLLGDAWRDPGLALPPLSLLKRAAFLMTMNTSGASPRITTCGSRAPSVGGRGPWTAS